MDSRTNPYTPNAGAAPELVVGRTDQLESFKILLGRLSNGRTEQSMILTGLRGVGKTVLLGEFRELALAEKWRVVEIEASKHDESSFRKRMYAELRSALFEISPRDKWGDRAKRAASALTSFGISSQPDGGFTVSTGVSSVEGLADHGDLAMDLSDLLVALGEAAQEHKTGLVLLVDEVQFLTKNQLEALIQAIHKTVQRRLPVTFVGAGLPQIAELAGDAKSYAERLFKFPKIDSLGESDAQLAFTKPAEVEGTYFTDEALELAFEITRGYPYFIQELGYQVWAIGSNDCIEREDVEAAREAYEAKLDSSFFRVRLDRATAHQTMYMRAMAQLGPQPQKAADVARLLGKESNQVGPTRAELINMGLLYTPEHGYAAFTVPDFDKFMMRAVPVLEQPPAKRSNSTS
ncbi:ATP-binding protein [Rhodoglobus aureus]|uniref:ATP-binding protein n=1 Tax=Rhodoglobus aureus TaxID=191497 RepID=A0ABN1VES1_9MICO